DLDPTICDPDTTRPDTTSMPGTTVCVGEGGATCDRDLVCPAATGARVSFCGRIYDLETDQPISAPTPVIDQCAGFGGAGAAAGPCQLLLQFYDAIAFAEDPQNATPIQPQGTFEVDDCGRF